ncbi:hypothetical protein PBPRB1256 [Photobacterium profundum SS9]|uniref:Uncharacterized protein n=1 Tax=Photobacterium profundum (strain SS9) TaxID=298386 RepID=Q6LHV3_PHOPR|nr:hypothetical protein PBPRB1256 [Photobacterium profundum SS9]
MVWNSAYTNNLYLKAASVLTISSLVYFLAFLLFSLSEMSCDYLALHLSLISWYPLILCLKKYSIHLVKLNFLWQFSTLPSFHLFLPLSQCTFSNKAA